MSLEKTLVLGTSTDFRKDLRRSEPRGDSGGSGWRKEAVKTGGRIHNITEKTPRDLFYWSTTAVSVRSATCYILSLLPSRPQNCLFPSTASIPFRSVSMAVSAYGRGEIQIIG